MTRAENYIANKKRAPFCVDFTISIEKQTLDNAMLFLTLNFFVEHVHTAFGSIFVAVRKARLNLVLNNAEMPLPLRRLKANFPISFQKKRTVSRDHDHSTVLSASIEAQDPTSSILKGGKLSRDVSDKTAEKSADEYTFTDSQVTCGGFQKTPFWDFESRGANDYLVGSLDREHLGDLLVVGGSAEIKAFIDSWPRYLWISGSEGIWPPDMNRSNLAVRKLAVWFWLKERIRPHLNEQCVSL